MAARRGREDGAAPPPGGGPGPGPGGGMRSGKRGCCSRSPAPPGAAESPKGRQQVLLEEEEEEEAGFFSLAQHDLFDLDGGDEAGDEEEMFLQDQSLLETVQSYMDASIISIIEDLSDVGESKVTSDDQNEVSLLTALTEILDNADSENPSPFDTIPDSELLVSPRESTSLHKLLGFSRSSPESDVDDQWGPKTHTMTPTIGRVEMCLSDPSWDLPPTPFLETSSPKIPGWKTPRSRPRWGQLSPLQRSDGEEEEDASLGRDRVATMGPSLDNTEDFPMHLACPEEEEEEEAAPVGEESISSLSELVRAMHPYCLPSLTVCLDSSGDEHEEQTKELMLAEGGMVLEILGQGSMAGEALEIPVVLRHLPPGQNMGELETDLTQQLLESDLEAETPMCGEQSFQKERTVPGNTEGGKEKELTCTVLPGDEVMPTSVDGPKGPFTDVSSDTQKSQRGHRSRRKKNEVLLVPDQDGDRTYIRKLRSSSRSQSTPDSQSSEQPLEGVSRGVQSSGGRRKPRARVTEPKEMLSLGEPDSAEPDCASLSPIEQSDLAKGEPATLCSSSGETSLASGNCDQSQIPEPSLEVTSPQSEGVSSSPKTECSANTGAQEAKPRPLSLSEYWQRRQQRQADEQVPEPQTPAGKWPSIPETPTELAEIPCLIVPSKTAEQHGLEVPLRPTAPGMARQRTAQQPGPKPPAGSVSSSLASPETDLPLPVKHTSLVRQSVHPTMPIPPAVPPTVSLPLKIPMPPALPPTMPPPPGGPGMPSMVPLSSSGQTMPDLLLPTLPPPCLPRPPDSYTQFAPVPSWPCYPSVPPSVNYPCLPPPVPGTSNAFPLPSTPAVPWALPPAPVTAYGSDHSYGPMGWGPGPQPPYWPAVPPTPLPPPPPPPPPVAQSIPPPTQATDSFSTGTCGSIPASSAVSVVPSPTLVPTSQEAPQIAPSRAEVKQGPASQQPLKSLSPRPKPRVATPESPGARQKGVPPEEPLLEKGQPMSEGSAPRNTQPEVKESGHSESLLVPVDATVSVPKQCRVAKMPSVHPSRLRRLNILPSTHSQGSKDVVQAFISEIGIEASDLSSLLEQFEKSEVKKECIPVGPADTLAIGNSGRVDNSQEKRPLDRLQAPELANVAGLTPPATPPHQLWKPLAAVSLLAKPGSPDSPTQDRVQKPVGNMEAKRAAAARLRGRVPGPSPVHVGSGDHDYCILSPTVASGPELGSRWNVKRHQDITIKPILSLGPSAALPACPATCQKQQLDHRTSEELEAAPPAPASTPAQQPSVLLSPEASPGRNDDTRTPPGPLVKQPVHCYQKAIASSSPPGHGWRGRSSRSCSNGASEASSSSSSSSSSRSRSRSHSHSPSRSRSRSISPPPKRWRRYRSRCSRSTRSSSRSSCDSWGPSRRRSSSSSSSSSPSSSSSSSQSRSRSPSPRRRSNRRRRYDYYDSQDHYQRQKILQKERAIEERRVVFIGKIPGCMTRSELKHRFSVFGEIEECTIHFRFEGDNYGFVTYRYAEEAFAAIESGHKLRRAGEQPFDLCFGGRRQFCKRNYADLDSNWEEFDPAPVKSKFDSVDFDTLLKQAQKNLRR
ncbi:peroxisome proliferator-activated receptor gamma coactivator-related protein 1 isoform X1 [Vombatus ursinus]|uniref:peroxisome proliferator-activated receptor gamma coactivator-related protein 1 isoform X1 n=1 Tax=Vombatus ursinus TaxID=29139 RepID=UPI000FFD4F16|nr:peroxisome proliferator-activated receptor gamma coactivator-related protein 1 isoform X1 [Vombatus ursinus]